MQTTRRLLVSGAALTALCLFLSSCASPVRVQSDYDPAFQFGGVQTWAWAPDPPGATGGENDLVRNRISAAIEGALAEKNLRRVETRPDLWVAFTTATRRGLDVRTSPSTGFHRGYGARRSHRHGYVGWTQSTTRVQSYTEGELIVDLVNPANEQLVWRGTGNARLREKRDPAEREARIQTAVDRILSQFPPGS